MVLNDEGGEKILWSIVLVIIKIFIFYNFETLKNKKTQTILIPKIKP